MTREELLQIAKPILFNTEMVRAILDDRKGCTRRTVKGYIPKDAIWGYTVFTPKGYISCRGTFIDGYGEKFFKLPCNKGDILYVRETWSDHYVPDEEGKAKLEYCYKADGTDIKGECLPGENNRWYPSIHMPKEAARIFLKVKDVRVERLQDIDINGIRKEGLSSMAVHAGDIDIALNEWKILWNSTIKKSDIEQYGWDANPWVWVIEFERIEV